MPKETPTVTSPSSAAVRMMFVESGLISSSNTKMGIPAKGISTSFEPDIGLQLAPHTWSNRPNPFNAAIYSRIFSMMAVVEIAGVRGRYSTSQPVNGFTQSNFPVQSSPMTSMSAPNFLI